MNDGKPSKEQLDYYFKTSRKYFDELAKQYQTTDKEYYDKNIAPYYNNPFVQVKSTGGIKIFIYVMAIFMSGMAILAFVVLSQKGVTLKDVFDFKDEPDETEVMYETVTVTEKKVPQTDEKFDTLAISYLKNDLEKGSYYYGVKKYDKAEYYLKRIAKNDNNYLAAQEILKLIEKEKSGNQNKK